MTNAGDFQCQRILNGLDSLLALLSTPLAREALTIDSSPETTKYQELLLRLKSSLQHYLERRQDLYYVGCVGHFSAGKSSTINSVLSLWGTELSRAVDNNPTDKVITLITHPANETSIIATAQAGRIPISARYAENDMLRNLVIADTPGTGDPLVVKELANEFLPLCDRILFFFSAASPFDEADIPILIETKSRLPFIPLDFVITRADEFRLHRSRPFSAENLNASAVAEFMTAVFSRVGSITALKECAASRRFLIDNYAQYGIAELRDMLVKEADPGELSSRLEMHAHKVEYFRAYAIECHAFLSDRLTTRFRDVTDVFDNAQRNVAKFQAHVQVGNSKITTAWQERLKGHTAVHSAVIQALHEVSYATAALSQLPFVSSALSRHSESLRMSAAAVAGRLKRLSISVIEARTRAFLNKLERRIGDVDVSRTSERDLWEGTDVDDLPDQFGDMDLYSTALKSACEDLLGAVPLAVQHVEDLSTSLLAKIKTTIDNDAPGADAEDALRDAGETLLAELGRYYTIVELYHTGVFARHGMNLISRLDIGRELDALSEDFSAEEHAEISETAKAQLLGDSYQALRTYRSELATLLSRLDAVRRPLRDRRESETSRESTPWLFELLRLEADRVRAELVENVEDAFRVVMSSVRQSVGAQLVTGVQRYTDGLNDLKRERRRRLVSITVFTGLLFTVASILYFFLTKPAGTSVTAAIGLGIISNILGDLLGFFGGRLTDKLPASRRTLAERENIRTRSAMRADASAAATASAQTVAGVNEPVLAARILRLFQDATQRTLREESARYASAWLKHAQDSASNANNLRQELVAVCNALLSAITTALGSPLLSAQALEDIAKRIRARAIDKSFELLDRTRTRTVEVDAELKAIRFS